MKRFLSIALIISLLSGVFSLSAFALETVEVYAADSAPATLLSAPAPFLDTPQDAWFFEAVQYVSARDIMRGTGGTAFSPDSNLSRAMMVSILHRMAGEPGVAYRPIFRDVPGGQWYSHPVVWAFESGVVLGTGPDTFAPHVNITREQLALMMRRYYLSEIRGADAAEVRQSAQWNSFADLYQISPEAVEALIWANYHGLIVGRTSAAIAPGGTATRAEAATIVMRFSQRFLDRNPTPPPPRPPQVLIPGWPSQPPDAVAFEREIFDLINRERANHGLGALEWDYRLAAVARSHSMDMAHRGFFAHVCPSGVSSAARLINAGFSFQTFAENLSLGHATPQRVIESLMSSPGHRANILNERMTHLGVGFYFGPAFFHGALPFVWTQKFIAV